MHTSARVPFYVKGDPGMKQYRVTFVLPGPSFLPPGGYNVVYQLAHGLNKRGIKTAIIFLMDPSKFIPDYKPGRGARVLTRRKKFSIFYLTANG